jgi:hypothetical protein
MRRTLLLSLAVVVAGLASSADAQTCVGAADAGECPTTDPSLINVDTTWCGPANPSPIILNEPVFVTGGATLTILAGSPGSPCIVRGQPRQAAVAMGVTAGTPGALIVTQTGKINAVGDPGDPTNYTDDLPIVFTTAAVDANGDNLPDNVDGNPGFLDPYPGGAVAFLDDDPIAAPLAPLNPNGVQNAQLWGGVVMLGNAPTNLSDFQGQGHGEGLIEGLTVPGFPDANARYGGVNPHDSSGRLRYVSIRHAGDEIGNGNELNCLSMGGLGDGTEIEFVECYANFDDGFEFFGGNVDTNHLVSSFLGDDLFDLDEGFTGIGQFWFGVMGNFNQDSGALYGTASGDKGCECDGENYIFDPMSPDLHNLSTRFQVASIPAPAAAVENTPWPLSYPAIFNMTIIGPASDAGSVNPATSPLSAAAVSGKRGLDLRNGFAGKIRNTLVVNMGTGQGVDVRVGDGSQPGFSAPNNAAAGLISIATSTFDNVAPIPGRDVAGASDEDVAMDNGDAVRVSEGAPNANTSLNCVNDTRGNNPPQASNWNGLANEDNFIQPRGDANGKLTVAANGPIDPDPLGGACSANGVVPTPQPALEAATYRGAFEAGVDNWTSGWTLLERSGVLATN